jgi:acyl-coenzyme A thioesterase PaaI-like protein
MAALPVKMTVEELREFLATEFPQSYAPGKPNRIVSVGPGTALVHFTASERHLRPGRTVSGPTMMGLADGAIYIAILAAIGPVALAVTTSFTCNFLSKPAPGDLACEVKILKLGKRLVVAEAIIRGINDAEPAAHVVATYSIPPRNG